MSDPVLPGVIAKPIAILTDDLHLTYANGAFAELFATSALQLDALGRAVRAEDTLHRAFTHALPRVSAVGRTTSFRWTTDAVPSRTYQVHVARLPDGGVLAILDEISDAVLSEDIQSGARRYLEEVLNHLDRAVLVVDPRLRVTFMNVAQRQLLERLGTTTSWLEFVGQPVSDAYPVLRPQAWRALCDDVVTCGTVGDRRHIEVRVGESRWWLDLRVLPLGEGAGGIGGAVIITEDVTRLTALEAAVVAREGRDWMSQVALSLDHEINNPLTTILGAAETLHDGARLSAPDLARVAAIRASALRVADVVRRLAAHAAPTPSAPSASADVEPATERDPGPHPDR